MIKNKKKWEQAFSFNCTFMELKLGIIIIGTMSSDGFNCTFMELKS